MVFLALAQAKNDSKAKAGPVVISLGGSMLFTPEGRIDRQYLKSLCGAIRSLKAKGKRPVVIVGGGTVARDYCEAVRELTGNEFYADRVGITATRLNATLILLSLGSDAYPKVVLDPDEALLAVDAGYIPVGAGMLEGMTTDADAVIIAERLCASKLVNVSKVPGVFNADPAKDPKARKFDSLTHEKLTALAAEMDSRKARTNFVFDIVACKLAQRSGLELHFVDGRKVDQVSKAALGQKHSGTAVRG